MNKIDNIIGRQILDSRGNPTVEVDVFSGHYMGRFAVPSGASTGAHEAVELRDNDSSLYLGKSVLKAVKHINTTIRSALLKKDVTAQSDLDKLLIELDGTENKSNLGANAILGVSVACTKCTASLSNTPLYHLLAENTNQFVLPVPMMNILNGGEHADNKIDFQEFMIMPVGASSFSHSLQMGTEVFHNLKTILKANHFSTNVGDEGGFAPNLTSNQMAIDFVLEAIIKSGYRPGEDISIALDAASTEMYDKTQKRYIFSKSDHRVLSSEEMITFWEDWVNKYPIVSIEDGLDEDDWLGWQLLNKKLGHKVQLVGDDLFVTNPKRLNKGIKDKSANSILIKVNQIGTLSETAETIEKAKSAGFSCVMSHRSGETEDSTIADLAVGFSCGQIKTGSASRSDRTAKYNQLLRIEEALGSKAVYGDGILKQYQ